MLTDAATLNFNPSLGGIVDNNFASHTDIETPDVITTPQYVALGGYTYFSDPLRWNL